IKGKQGRSKEDALALSSEKAKNLIYEAKIKVLADSVSNSTGAGALVFRSDEQANNTYATNVDVLNNQVKLIAFRDGIGKDLIIYDDGGKLDLKTNTDYRLKVTAEGEHIQVYLDDKLVIDAVDHTFSEGYAGLNVWNSTSLFNEVKLEIVD
ncbi:levanase, partial [Priestia megaterium]|nr:levanase [Priestia megaterium]